MGVEGGSEQLGEVTLSKKSPEERLAERVRVIVPSECWVPLTKKSVFFEGENRQLFEMSWLLYVGEMPKYLVQLCETEGCANFRHYEGASRQCLGNSGEKHPMNESNKGGSRTRPRCLKCYEKTKRCRSGLHLVAEVGVIEVGGRDLCRPCYLIHYTRCLRPREHEVSLMSEGGVIISTRRYVNSHTQRVQCCVICLAEEVCKNGHVMGETQSWSLNGKKRYCRACQRGSDSAETCSRGHPASDQYEKSDGQVACRGCYRERKRERYYTRGGAEKEKMYRQQNRQVLAVKARQYRQRKREEQKIA